MAHIIEKWTQDEVDSLNQLVAMNVTVDAIAGKLNRSYTSVWSKIKRLRKGNELGSPPVHGNTVYGAGIPKIPESPFPKFDSPLRSKGDAVVIPDFEAPFHHAEFVNRVLDLAWTWGIKTVHMAGDLVHYDSLSKWGAKWIDTSKGEKLSQTIQDFVLSLDNEADRQKGINLLDKLGELSGMSPDYANEIKATRRTFAAISSFDEIICILGNHDDRYLKQLDKGVDSTELLHQLGVGNDERWKIAPYYYSFVDTDKGTFRVTHQRASGQNVALDLVAQHHMNVLCAHTHRWAKQKDKSGKYWAILMGHCVDEERLAYVMQRDSRRDSHALGAVIIRDGYPFVLDEHTPFERMKKM